MNRNCLQVLIVLGLLALATSCTLTQKPVELSLVGPGPGSQIGSQQTGFLRVYTAVKCYSYDRQYYYAHTDYGIYATDGKRVKSVHNTAGFHDPNPAVVILPPGVYTVEAWANGYVLVKVPVVIQAGRVTTVNLEAGDQQLAHNARQTDLVRMPDGRIVGWSGNSTVPH